MSDLDRKFIITAELRELEKQVDQEEITYSRMVELLNEKANNWEKQQIIKGKIEVEEKYRDLWRTLDSINTIMWESYMIKNREFGSEEGKKIMQQLEKWAKKH